MKRNNKTMQKITLLLFSYLVPTTVFAQKLTNPLKAKSFEGLFRDILSNVIIPVTALIGVVFIIYAGFKFVTSQGNPEKLKEAKKRLLYVLIGVAIIITAEVILDLLLNTLTQIAEVDPGTN